MKKILLIILLLFTFSGCTKKATPEFDLYEEYVLKAEKINKTTNNYKCNIDIKLEKLTDEEVSYKVIIDNPKEEMRDIKAVVVHDKKNSDIFPSLGIFESSFNLSPEKIDKDNNYVKGLLLVGYIPYKNDLKSFKATFKVYITYLDELDKKKNIYFIKQY